MAQYWIQVKKYMKNTKQMYANLQNKQAIISISKDWEIECFSISMNTKKNYVRYKMLQNH